MSFDIFYINVERNTCIFYLSVILGAFAGLQEDDFQYFWLQPFTDILDQNSQRLQVRYMY